MFLATGSTSYCNVLTQALCACAKNGMVMKGEGQKLYEPAPRLFLAHRCVC